ncbi:MAG: GNAT family N-acetyltransferase [Sedimentisphaerales bacterium]|jgi:GNAT superfamily N-acetyltransferase|nr:GNAT family N-acetyltransferase [Sedimentisphaerales bacterium]HNY79907.1 GNAT family N-acetyltransferase [Sedimentisphaerales bacterium]HOC65006.1 GNAT family N-acetyltransferase [Sedimentisphaerales bacterium]HOH63285.1 GNAT family N-acetyltransferase [Sedimentisphaerales bacterium]HPY49279.1 GNAT family N-acetyltransferase [Sedimentisphaerales bacterium]
MTIRPACADETRTVVNVLRRACATVAKRFGLTEENCPKSPAFYTEDRVRADIERGVQYYFLEEQGVVCGCVALEKARPEIGCLERLAVLPEHRSKGFGSALVRHVLAQAWSMGLERVGIGIIAEDKPLREWYGRFGFVLTGTRRFDHLPFVVAFMEKELRESLEKETPDSTVYDGEEP